MEDESSTSQRQEAAEKRIRDQDGYTETQTIKVVGGVCSGIGYYFGVDPLCGFDWRLSVAVAIRWNRSILLYLILMMIVPEAKTASEKLAHEG